MDNNIKIIKETVKTFFPKSKIILFGSRAKNNYSEQSDYDLIIIIEENLSIKEKRNFQAKIRKKLANYLIAADIIIQNTEDIKIKKDITGHIIKQAFKEGVQI